MDIEGLTLNSSFLFTRYYQMFCENKQLEMDQNSDLQQIFLSDDILLMRYFDYTRLQDSCSVRNNLRCRLLAYKLVDDQGSLRFDFLDQAIEFLKKNLYFMGPEYHFDTPYQEFLLRQLIQLKEKKQIQDVIKTVFFPKDNKVASAVIFASLQLSEKQSKQDAHAKRAVLSAWFCFLRQSVGSCFATAPAILVKEEQSYFFLKELSLLIATGRLKRTFSGLEYEVPISPSWGVGDLCKPILLEKDIEKLHYTPGLLFALETVGMIDKQNSFKDKVLFLKKLLSQFLDCWNRPHTTPQEILRHILLYHYNISEADVDQYQWNTQKLQPMQVAFQLSSLGASKKRKLTKNQRCEYFIKSLELAQTAFKSLTDNALLKTWEYTLASFAEAKVEFCKWNLYASLGINTDDVGGIGHCLHQLLQQQLNYLNEKVQKLQRQYEPLYEEVKGLEMRMQRVRTEEEIKWLRAKYHSRVNEMRSLVEMRDKNHFNANRLASLYPFLIRKYDQLFPLFFQEIYDAKMHDVQSTIYDDRPAGFRLIFKHGRSNSSLWTFINNQWDFIESLSRFFTMTELEIKALEPLEGLEEVITRLISAVVQHIKTDLFLESALMRMAKAHGGNWVENPLKQLDKIEKKPWAYTSGGSMDHLVGCYFSLGNAPTQVSRKVENETELLVFLVDIIKELPEREFSLFKKYPNKSFLMYSPTHAFLFRPAQDWMCEASESRLYTYTWVRDYLIFPRKNFILNISLNQEDVLFLIKQLSKTKELSKDVQFFFKESFRSLPAYINPMDFKSFVMEEAKQNPKISSHFFYLLEYEIIDAFLWKTLPLMPYWQLKENLLKLFSLMELKLSQKEEEALKVSVEKFCNIPCRENVISSCRFIELAKMILMDFYDQIAFSLDLHRKIHDTCQRLGYVFPSPIIFADTNWIKNLFAFIVNPGNGNLELWRTDLYGINAHPMNSWKKHFQGDGQSLWGVYTKPYEYKQNVSKKSVLYI